MRWAVPLLILATPAVAQLSETDQMIVDRLQPVLAEQLGSEKSATYLAECIAESASNRDARTMSGSADDAAVFAIANKIMQQPELMTCVTQKLTQ